MAESVGTENVGTEDLGHIKKTKSFKKTKLLRKLHLATVSEEDR